MNELFTKGVAVEDQAYINIRDSEKGWMIEARMFCEELWSVYYPYADDHFLAEIQRDFYSRFWEMYLACSLLDMGMSLSCPKPGPDIRINTDDGVIWIEAVAPTAGAPNSSDEVKNRRDFETHNVPEEQIILRYRNAIHEKYNTKYFEYLRKGIVSKTDSYVIAVNGCKIPYSRTDFSPPRIVRTVLPVGYPQVTIDRKSNRITATSYQYRDKVTKKSGSGVSTAIFFDEFYDSLSAVLFSNVDPVNRPQFLGQDFVLTHNQRAANPISKAIIRRGREYRVKDSDEGFELSYTELD
jgi:type I restriction enzyme S subunit